MSEASPLLSCDQLLDLSTSIAEPYEGKVDVDLLREVLCRALRNEGWTRSAAVSVVVTNDEEVHELNRDYRGVDSPTDVLSFSQMEGGEFPPTPPDLSVPLGDIVISYPRVEAQATEYGHSERREFAYLAVHGLLHLLGYDHETEAERQTMRQKEESALVGISRDGTMTRQT